MFIPVEGNKVVSISTEFAEEHVAEIRNAIEAAFAARDRLLCGALVDVAKNTLGHGNFKKWFKACAFPFSLRTANLWMKSAINESAKLKSANDGSALKGAMVRAYSISIRIAKEGLRQSVAAQAAISPEEAARVEAKKEFGRALIEAEDKFIDQGAEDKFPAYLKEVHGLDFDAACGLMIMAEID